MECILCAKDVGVGYSPSFRGFESETPPEGDIRLVDIGETASRFSVAVEADLDNVGDGLACSVVRPGSDHFEDGDSSVLALACLQNRWKGVGDATLSTSS